MNARVKCTQDHLTCVGTVECLQVSVVYQLVFHLIVPSFLPSLSFSPSHGGGGGAFEKVWKKDGWWSVQKYLAVQMGSWQHSV